MTSFAKLVGPLLKREGGYVNHPRDRGAATNMGITQRTYTMWRVSQNLGYKDVRDITKAEATAIYKVKYWDEARCEDVPESLQEIHFDSAVNHGVSRAIKLLQEASGVVVDGIFGAKTLAASTKIDVHLLFARYVIARYDFYGEIIDRDRSQLEFITGWMRRMRHFTQPK